MWKPRMLCALLLIWVVAISLLAVVFAAAQPASPEQALKAGDGARHILSERNVGMGPAALPAQMADPNWQTWVNDVAWTQDMAITSETSDTIAVVNVVTTLPSQDIELVETWTPGRLKLLDVAIQPGGSTHTVAVGRVTWQVPEGASQAYTMTKWFHVEPSTWTETVLTEALSVLGQTDVERLVTVNKTPPVLWIESDYVPTVQPGDVATLTVRYGNASGYENGVWIRADLPSQAPFAWSDPPPDVLGPGRLMARWAVGDLARDGTGEILVAIAVTETLLPPPTVAVWSGIFNHVDVVQDEVTSTFTVETPVQEVAWEKVVNGQPWNPDLVVTALASDTIEVLDVVSSTDHFILIETWNPEHLSLVGYEAPAGAVSTGIGRLEWDVPPGYGEVILSKIFHVEPGFWDWTMLEEVLEVGGEPRVRLLPVRQRPITFPGGEWPWYAQGEITVHPEPAVVGQPTELCAEVVNHDPERGHPALIEFAVSKFGIGLPFEPVGQAEAWVPPGGHAVGCTVWVPPSDDHWCIEVRLIEEGEPYVISRRNVDLDEPLAPNTLHERTFPVRNPFDHAVTVTLGLIPHFPDWGLELSQDVLPAMNPLEVREVTLTVTPPADLPADGDPIVDVEAYVEGELIGGFRKIFRPPVAVHRPRDPVYAESEIGVDPYPALPGQPTQLSVEVFNPTATDRIVTVTFSIAPFGIGLPFSPAHIVPNPIRVFVPARGAARGHVVWTPPDWAGKFCVRVTLALDGYEPVWSQRNIDVGEPLRPGVPHEIAFLVGNPFEPPVTVTLGLIPHLVGWGLELSQDVLPAVQKDEPVVVTLTVTPPGDAELGTSVPIVDVEGFVDGELIGGFRKLDRPPVPLHKLHEKSYAETEIIVEPYPPQQGVPTGVSTVLQNTSDTAITVDLAFGWAAFGVGIPFTTTGMVPPTRSVTLGPMLTETATVTWTPVLSGHQCIQVRLNTEGYEPQQSQRNVDVTERPPCGETKVFTFTVYNDSALNVTVDVGTITFNVPADWQITVTPSPTLALGPFDEGVITVTVQIPCPSTLQALQAHASTEAIQQAAGSVPTIDVEGYVAGELKGGIEIQFAESVAEHQRIYLPLVLRNQ